jgi:hypothetical protein
MSKKIVITGLLSLLLIPTIFPVTVSVSQEQAKWFVLRHATTGNCWTALLISIKGDYRSANALKAGGPYDSEDKALAEKKDLERRGVCKG